MKLYRITNGLGEWYVVASDATTADHSLEDLLEREGYGFASERQTRVIEIVTEAVDGKVHSTTRLLIVEE